MKYRFAGKEKRLSLGVYPDVGSKDLRGKPDALRKLVAQGVDPADHRMAIKVTAAGANSFEHGAREWHARRMANQSPGHAEKGLARLEKDVFPWLGKRDVGEISAPDVLAMLRRIDSRGAIGLTHVTKRVCGRIFRYAIATGRAERDPAADLKGAIQPVKAQHFAAITDPGYRGIVACHRRLYRTLRYLMHDEHIVPLSRQAVGIFEEIRPLTGAGRYVFPSIRTASGSRNERPMSEKTVLSALRRMGYTTAEMTADGFRTIASARLNESHLFHADAVERQVAYGERDSGRAACNHAEYRLTRAPTDDAVVGRLLGFAQSGPGCRAAFR